MQMATKFVHDTTTTTTREFKCPRCGCEVTHRNWDTDHNKMNYQCAGCGTVTALDYKEVYYLRTQKATHGSAYVTDEHGDKILFGYDKFTEDVEVPENPNAAILEVMPNGTTTVADTETSSPDTTASTTGETSAPTDDEETGE